MADFHIRIFSGLHCLQIWSWKYLLWAYSLWNQAGLQLVTSSTPSNRDLVEEFSKLSSILKNNLIKPAMLSFCLCFCNGSRSWSALLTSAQEAILKSFCLDLKSGLDSVGLSPPWQLNPQQFPSCFTIATDAACTRRLFSCCPPAPAGLKVNSARQSESTRLHTTRTAALHEEHPASLHLPQATLHWSK